MSWWPYGKVAVDLARAVLGDDPGLARRHAQWVMEEAKRYERFEEIESKLCEAAEACQWDKCDELLRDLENVGVMDTGEVVRYQTMVSFERGWTVLDRIEQATKPEEE